MATEMTLDEANEKVGKLEDEIVELQKALEAAEVALRDAGLALSTINDALRSARTDIDAAYNAI